MGTSVRRYLPFILGLSLFAGLLPLAAPATTRAAGAIDLDSANSAHVQDFDSLAASGTANVALPNGWWLHETGTSSRNDGGYAAGTRHQRARLIRPAATPAAIWRRAYDSRRRTA